MITREEALRLCEIVLAQAKAAGAEDASVSLNSSIESHARFAGNRITTSGRAEDLDITATVWVERRRGAAAGNDADGGALKRLADEAVQIARVSPVHREYVPTPGPLEYGEAAGFAAATADVDLAARASALEAALAACRTAKVTGAGFHVARASAAAAATANGNRRFFRSSEGSFSLTARSADGTGSGYFAGDHFDLGAPRRAANRRAGGEQGGAVAAAEEHRTGRLPGRARAAGGVRSDGFPGRQLRREDRRRGTQRVLGQGRKDAGRRDAVQPAHQSVQRPEARRPPGCAGDRRGSSRDPAVARQSRRARESAVLAVLGA